jgi:hypothetical protein
VASQVRQLLRERTDEAPEEGVADDPILVCKTRALGHDWAGGTSRWEDGDSIRVIAEGRKRASVVYVCYAVTDCPRCTTVRTEVFQQVEGRWLDVPSLSQSELNAMRRRRDRKQ